MKKLIKGKSYFCVQEYINQYEKPFAATYIGIKNGYCIFKRFHDGLDIEIHKNSVWDYIDETHINALRKYYVQEVHQILYLYVESEKDDKSKLKDMQNNFIKVFGNGVRVFQ